MSKEYVNCINKNISAQSFVCRLTTCLIILIIAYGCAGNKTATINAAGSGDISTIKSLQDNGRNINEADSNGATPLMYAIWSKKPDAAKYLIEAGADVKAKDINGYDALLYAIDYKQFELANILIGKGANLESRDSSGRTPLIIAVASVTAPGVMKKLISNGANVRVRDDAFEAVKMLIKKGANVNAKDSNNYDALRYAIDNNQLELVNMLIDKGANIESKDSLGRTPLHHAVSINNYDLVMLLIKKGANVKAKDADCETVLDLALSNLSYGRVGIVTELVDAGARLLEPEAGKARLFFIGVGLWDSVLVTVGNRQKNMQTRGAELAFIDVEPGDHIITIPVGWLRKQPTASINIKVGQTYYFKISQYMTSRILNYFTVVSGVLGDQVTDTGPFSITPLKESEAKEIIKVLIPKIK